MCIMKRALGSVLFSRRTFEFFQKFDIHVLHKHYYSPIPDTHLLGSREEFSEKERELVGVELNMARQLDLLVNVFPNGVLVKKLPLRVPCWELPIEHSPAAAGPSFAA